MTFRPPVSRLALIATLLVAAAQTGCVSTAPQKKPGSSATEAFVTSLSNARAEGRREVDDILGVYANLPADQAPGVAAFRRDVAEAQARLTREKRERLTIDEVDALTIRNPHYWHAWFELSQRDASVLMLHGSLLMESGELFRASMVFTVGVQAFPLNVQERTFWFTQQARTHWSVFRRLDELREVEKKWGGSRRARERDLRRIVSEWPADGIALEALIQSRAGFEPGTLGNEDNAPIALTPKVRELLAPDLAKLRRINPVAWVRYHEDREMAAEFGRLWVRLIDEDRAIEQRELVQFAELSLRLGLGELAMIAGRAVSANRGFVAPADLDFFRRCLPLVLPADEAAALYSRIEEGRVPGFQLTRLAEQATEVLKGMDSAVHPLLADHAVREYARETLWITAAGDNKALRAEHLRVRALGSANVGRFEAALADIDEALELQPGVVPWLIDRAVILSKLGRIDEAEALFAQVRKKAPKNDYLRSSLAVFAFGQQRFGEAEELFRTVPADHPNRSYEAIFAYLAGLRRGESDRTSLEANRPAAGQWPAPIQDYLLGRIDRAELLRAARDTFDLRTTEQQCEAYFSLAQSALAKGDATAARRELENCVQSGIVGFIEYDLARRELERLGPPAKTPGGDRPAPAPRPVPSESNSAERHGGGTPA